MSRISLDRAAGIDHRVGAEPLGDRDSRGDRLDRDDEPRAARTGGRRDAEPDGPLGEDGHRVSEAKPRVLDRGEPGRHDVGREQRSLVVEIVGDLRHVELGVLHQVVLALAAEQQVGGRGEGLADLQIALLAAGAVAAAEEARGDHAITLPEARHAVPCVHDLGHGFVPHRCSGRHREARRRCGCRSHRSSRAGIFTSACPGPGAATGSRCIATFPVSVFTQRPGPLAMPSVVQPLGSVAATAAFALPVAFCYTPRGLRAPVRSNPRVDHPGRLLPAGRHHRRLRARRGARRTASSTRRSR